MQVIDPEFHRLVAPDAKVEKVATGFTYTEGPVFSRLGFLLFSDIPPQRILRWEAGKVTTFRENSNRANGLTFDHQGRLLTCEAGRVTRTEKDGKITVLAAAFDGKPLNTPNDLVYSIDGSIYFTDIRPANAPADSARADANVVYQITRKGELRVVARDCARPNGVALGPDQRKLFVADTTRRNVRVYDVAADGALTGSRVFAELKTDQGGPDGLKTDEGGNVWVAGPGGVWVFNASGKHIGTVTTPEAASNCSFGAGFRSLYITARTSVYHVRTLVPGTRTF